MTLKKLHRIYFGFDNKPDIFDRYLATWERELPDFEICKWDASKLPMDCNPYVRELYEKKDHAFLTDYFRWWVLREFGGAYLDADIEVVNGKLFAKLINELEVSTQFDAFIGIDEKKNGWYTAHSMASKPDSEMSKFMCRLYENMGDFVAWRKKALYLWAPQLAALYFARNGHNVDGMGTTPGLESPQVLCGVKVYPQDYFSPLAPTGRKDKPFILNANTDNTSRCHHFACTWHQSDSIYAAHADTKGGRVGVMLKDLENSTSESTSDKLRKVLPDSFKKYVRDILKLD